MRLSDIDPFPQNGVIVFNHVTKSGGTSLYAFFQKTFGARQCHWHRERDRKTHALAPGLNELPQERLQEIRFASGHFDYGMHRLFEDGIAPGEALARSVFNIGIVREPLERLASDYSFNREDGSPANAAAARSMDFTAYVRSKLDNPNSILATNSQIRQLTGCDAIPEAVSVLQEHYLLVCTTPQLSRMLRLLHRYFGQPGQPRALRRNRSQTTAQALASLDPAVRAELIGRTALDLAFVAQVSRLYEEAEAEWLGRSKGAALTRAQSSA